ncbi:MAG: response regulator [Rhodocyclaceae bacterium]|nr:response regulator [Rhodocyclaceae bacterium]
MLLVEDNPGDALLTREALRDAKMANRLDWVQDGVEAMDYLRRQGKYADASPPDLILLDLNMPRMDGREVLAELKNDTALKHIPVVVLTTSQAEEDILRAYELHANCFIGKPVDFAEFVRVVKSIESFWFSVVRLPRSP